MLFVADFLLPMPVPSLKPRVALIGLLVAIAAVGGYWVFARSNEEKAAGNGAGASAIPVTIAEAQQRDVPERISSIGTLQSLHTVVLQPQVTGIVTEILFREGEMIERGALLARIDDRSIRAALAQAQAEKHSGEAELRIAELDLSRYTGLRDPNIVSRQTIEQQAALVEKLKAAIEASEARIAAQRVQLSFTEIRSPLRGKVGIRRVDPGNLVQAGDERGLVTVTQLDPISAVFTLPQELLPRLHQAASAKNAAEVIAVDSGTGLALARGRLTTIDNQIDIATGTLRLRAEFDNADGALWPGQFVGLHLQTGISADAVVVPACALQQGLDGAFVYRVRDDQAQIVQVVTSYADDEIAIIADGLGAGDAVVVDGQSRLKSGARVKIVAGAEEAHAAGS